MDGPTDIDALAEALREDGVVIDRAMGSGEAQESEDRISALVREVPFPVYVALVETPEGLPDDGPAASDALAGLLNRRLGDGLYVIRLPLAGQQVWSYGLGADPSRLSLADYANRDVLEASIAELAGPRGTEDYVSAPPAVVAEVSALTAEDIVEVGRQEPSSGYPATLDQVAADRLAERAVELAASASWRPGRDDYVPVRTASAGLSAVVGGLVGLCVALLLGQTLVGWPRRRRAAEPEPPAKVVAPPPPPPDVHAERRIARSQADALAKALSDTDWNAVRDRDTAGRALTARDAVEQLLTSRDVADLVGAQVVARAGSRDLSRGRRGTGESLRTCFFDPRHSGATATASWRLGDGDVEVPCCAVCASAVAEGEVPAHLRLATRRGSQPYWERDDVWARTGFGAISDFLARDVLADREASR